MAKQIKNLKFLFTYYIFIKSIYVKEKLFIPDLVTCYFRDAQRDWIECLRVKSESYEQKCKFLKSVQPTFLRKWRNASHIKYRCKIIGRLISIKVL